MNINILVWIQIYFDDYKYIFANIKFFIAYNIFFIEYETNFLKCQIFFIKCKYILLIIIYFFKYLTFFIEYKYNFIKYKTTFWLQISNHPRCSIEQLLYRTTVLKKFQKFTWKHLQLMHFYFYAKSKKIQHFFFTEHFCILRHKIRTSK